MPMPLCGSVCAVMDWFSQPAFNSGILPFLVALLLSLFLRRFFPGLRGTGGHYGVFDYIDYHLPRPVIYRPKVFTKSSVYVLR